MILYADSLKQNLSAARRQKKKPLTETTQFDIKSLIYVVRNQQVMIDSDLAMLYQVFIIMDMAGVANCYLSSSQSATSTILIPSY